MDRISPAQLKERIEAEKQDCISRHREMCLDMLRLVQSNGYCKAKGVALTICDQYKGGPPATDAERQRWETYNTLLWGFNQLFGEIEKLAKTAPDIDSAP